MKNIDKQIFDRQSFIDLAKAAKLNVEHIRQLSDAGNHEIVVGGKLLDMLIEVQNQFERLEAMGDDEFRAFHIELPRPTLEEWGNCEEEIADWEAYNPMETYWYHVSVARYNEYRSLIFNNKKFRYFVITNQSSYALREPGFQNGQWYEESLVKIFSYLKNLIDAIVSNPDDYNEYVANNLPYQLRYGRIARKDFNRIEPRFKIEVEDREWAIKALEASIRNETAEQLSTMTIRQYCKYFRIGHEAYVRYFQKISPKDTRCIIPKDTPEELLDVAYYNNAEFKHINEKYNLDSEEDFKKFARDHYGELGLSRLDICASNFQRKGWVIGVYNSYSANVDVAIDVATALYKSGAPLEISNAEKLLKILNEEDYVGLIPRSFHDYMNHHDEGTVYELPWEYQLYDGCDDSESLLTKAQYDEIVSLAEWDEIRKVKVSGNSSGKCKK